MAVKKYRFKIGEGIDNRQNVVTTWETGMTNLIGQSLGRYHIIEQLGEGGMAIVYKAYDTRLESEVAVKVIRTENLAPSILERALKRFEREAKALAKLTHSNIVKVLDYGEYEGKPYLVMPFLPGGTLKERLKGQPMPWQDAARLLVPIARALAYAHSEGMIHRDVKPSNILITRSGDPMLTDFGIAKIIDEEMTIDLTGTSAAVGTPEYMAPEQVTSKTVDQRADIYALGVVLYEMITGHKPFTADTPMAVLFKHASEPLPRPRSFVPNLPEAAERILIKALAKKKEDRYQNMTDFAAALENLAMEKGGIPQSMPLKQTGATSDITHTLRTREQDSITGASFPSQATTQVEGNQTTKRLPVWLSVAIGIGVALICLLLGILALRPGGLLAYLIVTETITPSLTSIPPTLPPTLQPTLISTSTPTEEPITPTSTLTDTPKPVSTGYRLEDCLTSGENICLYSISPQSASVIVALKYKSGISSSNIPYLTVGNLRFSCQLLDNYPGRIYCEGESISGDYKFTLRYSDTDIICTGTFTIREFFAPAPTKKPGSSGGGKYP
jgi:serine/threonine protein kinase